MWKSPELRHRPAENRGKPGQRTKLGRRQSTLSLHQEQHHALPCKTSYPAVSSWLPSMQSLGRLAQLSYRLAAPSRYFSSSVSGVFPHRSVCKATIVGRTGRVPDFYEFQSGGSSLTFSVATSQIRVVDGVRDEEDITQWNRVNVYNNYPGYDAFLKDISPGTLVYVEGMF